MPPENQYPTPTPQPQVSAPLPPQQQTTNSAPNPDYSFLNQQPKKSLKLPLIGSGKTNSFAGRVIVILLAGLLLVILIIIVKGIISPASFSKADYLLLTERQNEMLRIMNIDITSANISQLSTSDQNFVSTATAALTTAESKTLKFMADYHYKVSADKVAKVYVGSVDTALSTAQSSNNLDATFKSEMQGQLTYYERDLKSAYSTTRISNGRELLSSEYSEAQLLSKALGSSS